MSEERGIDYALETMNRLERKYITLRHWLRDRHPESNEEYFNTHYEQVEDSWITNE